jgi:hypothetical protein
MLWITALEASPLAPQKHETLVATLGPRKKVPWMAGMTALEVSPSLPTVILPSRPLWPTRKTRNSCRYIKAMEGSSMDRTPPRISREVFRFTVRILRTSIYEKVR